MGAIRVTVKISNLAQPEQSWEGEFLADTSVHETTVPRKHLQAIGIAPTMRREYELADGSSVTFDVGSAQLEFIGRFTANNVLFGADDAEPVLGAIALRSAGAEVDVHNECLKLGPPMRMPLHRPRRPI